MGYSPGKNNSSRNNPPTYCVAMKCEFINVGVTRGRIALCV
jgi:hypothetical protein